MAPRLEFTTATAFDDLVAIHLDAAYRVALAILRDPEEARDAVQDAAFKAWRSFGQLRDGQAARPWFLRIVANQCRSVRRRHWWSVVRMPEIYGTGAEFESASAAGADLQQALARLSTDERLPLFLHFYLDLPLDEVGAVLGLSAAGAKTRVYRAARKLRPALELDL
ncbi:MAG TPA: sigma-70 family RNA polymerase sigma factor [Candidatus Dormibacteraeota bacterium]|nr:sigma-70 family RNA polymerase sigma factor [Candidatus Dormibacteraeota bacterium]